MTRKLAGSVLVVALFFCLSTIASARNYSSDYSGIDEVLGSRVILVLHSDSVERMYRFASDGQSGNAYDGAYPLVGRIAEHHDHEIVFRMDVSDHDQETLEFTTGILENALMPGTEPILKGGWLTVRIRKAVILLVMHPDAYPGSGDIIYHRPGVPWSLLFR